MLYRCILCYILHYYLINQSTLFDARGSPIPVSLDMYLAVKGNMCYRTAWVRGLSIVLVDILLSSGKIIRTSGVGITEDAAIREDTHLQLWAMWGAQYRGKKWNTCWLLSIVNFSKRFGSRRFIEIHYAWQLSTHKSSVGKLPVVAHKMALNRKLIVNIGYLTLIQRLPARGYLSN